MGVLAQSGRAGRHLKGFGSGPLGGNCKGELDHCGRTTIIAPLPDRSISNRAFYDFLMALRLHAVELEPCLHRAGQARSACGFSGYPLKSKQEDWLQATTGANHDSCRQVMTCAHTHMPLVGSRQCLRNHSRCSSSYS